MELLADRIVEFHLSLDADSPRDTEVICYLDRVLEHSGHADARARRTRPTRAVAFPCGIEHSVDDPALALSVEQLLPGPRDHPGSSDWGHDYGFPGREGSTSVTTMPA